MAENAPRLSHRGLQVLKIFLEARKSEIAGSDIVHETGMLSGTLYPILIRFERTGWLESEWEQLEPREAGRPRKRYYRLTAAGRRAAAEALTQLGAFEGRLAWQI